MRKFDLAFAALLVPLDYFLLVLAGIAAYFLRFASFIQRIRPVAFSLPFSSYLGIVAFTALVWLVIFAFSGLYSLRGRRRYIDEFYKIFSACSVGIMLIFVFIFMSREWFNSRFIVLAAWGLSIIFVFAGRLAVRWVQKKLFIQGKGVQKLLVIGNDKTAQKIVRFFQENPAYGYQVSGVIKDGFEAKNFLHRVRNLIRNRGIKEIIQVEDLGQELTLQLVDLCNEFHVVYKYVPSLFETKAANIEVFDLGGFPLLELKRTPLDGWGKIIKRGYDLVGSAIAIVVFSPLMLLIALAIKLDSPGPVFFGYYRIGQYGKPFFYFKFRSMIKDAHKMRYDPEFRKKVQDTRGWNEKDPMIKYKNDPRITRVGKFLRRYSLDELPEFFNVFLGKMSLVGPRPHEPEEVAKYKKEYKKVFTIKPGITGLSQVSGRSDLSFEEEVKLDFYYIENWSLKLDLYILFKTPFAVFRRRKAI